MLALDGVAKLTRGRTSLCGVRYRWGKKEVVTNGLEGAERPRHLVSFDSRFWTRVSGDLIGSASNFAGRREAGGGKCGGGGR